MNDSQKVIVIFGFLIFALSMATPPWTYTYTSDETYRETAGVYGFIGRPPKAESPRYDERGGVKVDATRLFAQSLGILAVFGALALLVTVKPDDD